MAKRSARWWEAIPAPVACPPHRYEGASSHHCMGDRILILRRRSHPL
ncbi:hypothetical protein [Microseira sp. BLCC-F43]